jgi:hypothetical protein
MRSSPNCDLGAFESQGFILTKTSGDNQSTVINTIFSNPLCVSVIAKGTGELVNGGKITFTSPANGSSANLTDSSVTITGGAACSSARANGIEGGPYAITTSTAGATSVTFNLTNSPLIKIYLPMIGK